VKPREGDWIMIQSLNIHGYKLKERTAKKSQYCEKDTVKSVRTLQNELINGLCEPFMDCANLLLFTLVTLVNRVRWKSHSTVRI